MPSPCRVSSPTSGWHSTVADLLHRVLRPHPCEVRTQLPHMVYVRRECGVSAFGHLYRKAKPKVRPERNGSTTIAGCLHGCHRFVAATGGHAQLKSSLVGVGQ